MELQFACVTAVAPDSTARTVWEGTQPDEYDLMELLHYNEMYAPIADLIEEQGIVHITLQHFCFSADGRETMLADEGHLALIAAYNELAADQGQPGITECRAVDLTDSLCFTIRAEQLL